MCCLVEYYRAGYTFGSATGTNTVEKLTTKVKTQLSEATRVSRIRHRPVEALKHIVTAASEPGVEGSHINYN
jgi:hypothetical protein